MGGIPQTVGEVLIKLLLRTFFYPNIFPFGEESTGLKVAGLLISLFTLSCLFMWIKQSRTARKTLASFSPFILFIVIVVNIYLLPNLMFGIIKGIVPGWLLFIAIIALLVWAKIRGLWKTAREAFSKVVKLLGKLFDATKEQAKKIRDQDEADEKGAGVIWFGAIISILSLNAFFHRMSDEKNSYAPSYIFLLVCISFCFHWCWKLLTGKLPPVNGRTPEDERKVAELTIDKNGWLKGFWILLQRRFSEKAVTWTCGSCGSKNPLTREKCEDCQAENLKKDWKCEECGNENWSSAEQCDCGTPNPHLKDRPPRKEPKKPRKRRKVDEDEHEMVGASDVICWNCFRILTAEQTRCICSADPNAATVCEKLLMTRCIYR